MKANSNIQQSIDAIGGFTKPCVLAIGMFDGLHRGHKRVLAKCLKLAQKYNALAAILTFEPHPSTVIKMPHPPAKMLFNSKARAQMFAEAGAKKVFIKKFDKKFAATTPADFAKSLGKKFPNLRAVVTGENFLFGKNAEGNARTLKQICREHGWEYAAVKRMNSGGLRISSTRLRNALEAGKMSLYKNLAGKFYEVRGKVKGGRKIGRTIGFPTLNVPWNPDCKPPYGAYVVQVENSEGKTFEGVASYGTSPTVAESEPLVETHILGKTSIKTGANLKIRFLKFLRAQKKFASLEELKKQIAKDKIAALRYFNRK